METETLFFSMQRNGCRVPKHVFVYLHLFSLILLTKNYFNELSACKFFIFTFSSSFVTGLINFNRC